MATELVPISGTSSVLNPISSPHRSSSAQICNEDALFEVMTNLTNSDLAAAALVCVRWLTPARRRLYNSIIFDTSEPRTQQLHDTLVASPYLRPLVCHVYIGHYNSETHSLFEWMSVLPEYSLQEVTNFLPIHGSCPISILDYPAVKTVLHFALNGAGWFKDGGLDKVLSYRHLQSLIMSIPAEDQPIHLLGRCLPSLKRLSISSYEYYPLISQLLTTIESRLEQFDWHGYTTDWAEMTRFRSDIEQHVPSLKSLALVFNIAPEVPFVDDLVASFPMLESLGCTFGTYTTNVLARMPRTLRHLVLYSINPDSRRSRKSQSVTESSLWANMIRRGDAPIGLAQFILAYDPEDSTPISCGSLKEACEEKGIGFDMVEVEQELADRFQWARPPSQLEY